jgi:crotonobetainyl-CoA:carnitine CoA-transferase CaiB-like acyl-CoA transferase
MLGRPEPARPGSSEEVYGAVEDRSRQRSISEVLSVRAGRIACGPVNTAADIDAPLLGEHTDEILEEVGRRRAGLVTGPPPPPSTGSAGERP